MGKAKLQNLEKILSWVWPEDIRCIGSYILVLTFLALAFSSLSFSKSDDIAVNSFNYLDSYRLLDGFIEKDDLVQIVYGFNRGQVPATLLRQASLYAYGLQGIPEANWNILASTTSQYQEQLARNNGSTGLVSTSTVRAKAMLSYLRDTHESENKFWWISIVLQSLAALYALRIVRLTTR